MGDDPDAPRVAHRDVDVHVGDPDVACNARAPPDRHGRRHARAEGLAMPRHRTYSTRRAVVTQQVEAAAAAADARRQGERQPQAS